jgi:excisionase family DNA binding protein
MFEDKPEILSISEVAEMLNVTPMTLRRWDKAGILKAFRPSQSSKRRYHKKDVIAFVQSSPESGDETSKK